MKYTRYVIRLTQAAYAITCDAAVAWQHYAVRIATLQNQAIKSTVLVLLVPAKALVTSLHGSKLCVRLAHIYLETGHRQNGPNSFHENRHHGDWTNTCLSVTSVSSRVVCVRIFMSPTSWICITCIARRPFITQCREWPLALGLAVNSNIMWNGWNWNFNFDIILCPCAFMLHWYIFHSTQWLTLEAIVTNFLTKRFIIIYENIFLRTHCN